MIPSTSPATKTMIHSSQPSGARITVNCRIPATQETIVRVTAKLKEPAAALRTSWSLSL